MDKVYEKLEQLYILTEMTYVKNNKGKSDEEIFPIDWYSSKDYIKKVEILGDAIKNNTLIKDTEKYKEYMGLEKEK